jgi:hypothetical protein
MESNAPPLADARIAAWLAAEGVDASYAAFVVRHVDLDDTTWRWCCGSSCDPCVQRLGRVVDLARAARHVPGNPPPGIPGPCGPA